MADNKEKMSDKGIDLRLWFLSILAVMAAGYGLGVVLQQQSTSVDRSSNTILQPTFTAKSFSPHHMIYDMKNVSQTFLQSPEQIQQAMDKTLNELQLHLVSRGCHAMDETSSYSCLLVLQEGQAAIHAFAETGVLSIDLALYYSDLSLIPAVDIVKQNFEIGKDVNTMWTIDLRGEPEQKQMANHVTMGSPVYLEKKQLYSGSTKYHRVDVWSTKSVDGTPQLQDGLKHKLAPDDPRWLTNELAPIDVDLYVDGNFILSSDPEFESDAEIDVHPVMFAHPNPKRIAFISNSGDEGPNLRSILTHDIESVTIFQPDEELVNIVKKYLPKAFDCSNIEGIADDCHADKLVNWKKEAALEWFPANYGGAEAKEAAFDVVFGDANTPNLADRLAGYVNAIFKSLSSNGVFGVNLGIAPTILHPRLEYGYFAKHDKLIQTLEALEDVEAIMVYSDDFSLNDEGAEVAPSAWLIACKSASCRDDFFASPEVVDAKIASRIVRAKNGKAVPEYFDGVLNHGLQSPPKSFETIYCRRDPVPVECNYRELDFSRQMFEYSDNEEESAFKIEDQSVIATVDIPAGSYIMPGELSKSVVMDSSALDQVDGSGEPSCTAEGGSVVEIGPSNLIRSVASEEEANVGKWFPSSLHLSRPKYSPVYDSHGHSFDVFLVATREIAKGEELVRYSRT